MSGKDAGTPVTGNGTISYSALTGATFEGQQALMQSLTLNATFYEGTNSLPFALSGQGYYTTNYNMLGTVIPGVSYCVAQAPIAFPYSAKVGDTAILGTINCYQDSTKAVTIGTDVVSYIIEADTATTAIVNQIINTYSPANALQEETQTRFRVDQNGNETFVSMTLTVYTTSPTSVLTFTAT